MDSLKTENVFITQKQLEILIRRLKQFDKDFQILIGITKKTTIYKYLNSEWHDLNTKGTIYIYKNINSYKLVVFNLNNPCDFSLNLLTPLNFEIIGNLVAIRTSKNKETFGFWFEKLPDAEELLNLIKSIKL